MSRVWRQTISDDLDQVVEETRGRLHLTIQELTIAALAEYCERHQRPQPPATPPPSPAAMLSFD